MTTPTNPTRHEQFVALFVRHEAAVHSFIMTLVPSMADAEEVLQEASMTMWRRFDQYQSGTSFRNWAFQVAKYTAFNFVRKLARDRHRFSENVMMLLAEHAEREQSDREARRRTLEHCIAKLEEGERSLLSSCYAEGSTIKKYAEEEGRTPNAVSKQLNRVRRTLLLCVQQTLRLEASS
ncbi:sigma-70 family RNA polymerase sigma factor [Botrimarina hoheduenensis]|uniref:ECF RNA polymerase sigma-E factor n=1 Tax=Botrimarina hoheduenensis TaxID=2528000 RepID=A0A5C5VR65_9BACT|nr:sigma-70 family RNA polymerase sigma factor [Botrimarina hoheduenensis]TWT40640.1 ECF RNA polymerase sigma-E factor [Botrimarina hoheduenensis]